MIRQSFNFGWTAGPAATGFAAIMGGAPAAEAILPHDAVRDLPRDPEVPDGANNGYFPGGFFRYSKTFDIPAELRDKTSRSNSRAFYRDAMIFVNGEFAAQRPNGIPGFTIALDRVPPLRAAEHHPGPKRERIDDSGWYTGAGIYRNTRLHRHRPHPRGARRTPDHHPRHRRRARRRRLGDHGAQRAASTPEPSASPRRIDGPDGGTPGNRERSPVTLLPGAARAARQRLYVPSPVAVECRITAPLLCPNYGPEEPRSSSTRSPARFGIRGCSSIRSTGSGSTASP